MMSHPSNQCPSAPPHYVIFFIHFHGSFHNFHGSFHGSGSLWKLSCIHFFSTAIRGSSHASKFTSLEMVYFHGSLWNLQWGYMEAYTVGGSVWEVEAFTKLHQLKLPQPNSMEVSKTSRMLVQYPYGLPPTPSRSLLNFR